jgi:hypothetical protein
MHWLSEWTSFPSAATTLGNTCWQSIGTTPGSARCDSLQSAVPSTIEAALGMASPCSGEFKLALRQFHSDEARELCQEALQFNSAAALRALIAGAVREHGSRNVGATTPSTKGAQ